MPALLIPMLLWYGSLRRRTAAIERYFDVAVRRPGARGPAREDPDAVAAFRAAQGLPYRLAGYQALACAFAVGRGRRWSGASCAASTPARRAGCWARARSCCWRWRSTRRCCCATCCARCSRQLGARHRLPVDEVRAPITLRTKLVFFFSSVTVFTSGLVLLFALSPTPRARG